MNRFACVRKFASNIIEKSNLIPPIDPVKIIQKFGIEIVESDNQLGIEAFSDLGDIPRITINTEFTFPARKRFTLAHELGHIIIPWHNGDVKCDTDRPYNYIGGNALLDTQELEANIFASELLMPQAWLRTQIDNEQQSFKDMITSIQRVAETSVMACLYALEEVLPSGNVFFVKKDDANYWKKFASVRTCTSEIYSGFRERIDLLKNICSKQEHFNISQYEVYYFLISPCPEISEIKEVYINSNNIAECINALSDFNPTNIMPSLKTIINALDDIYTCFVFEKDLYVRSIKHDKSLISNYSSELTILLQTLEYNNLCYYVLDDAPYKLVFVKEEPFDLPFVVEVEPNSLLKNITRNIYTDNCIHMLQRINGILSNACMRIDDEKVIYSKVRYRFASDSEFVDFYNHTEFDLYVINKIRSILRARRTKS